MKPCKICRVEFKPVSSRSVTCGSEECKHANYILNRDKGKPSVTIENDQVKLRNLFLLRRVA